MTKEDLYHIIPGIETVCIFDNNHKQNACGYHTYEWLGGFGAEEIIIGKVGDVFEQLKVRYNSDWWMGCLGYDLKNEIEKLESKNYDGTNFPDVVFFKPIVVIVETNGILEFVKGDEAQLKQLYNTPNTTNIQSKNIHLQDRTSKENYIQNFEKIKQHIIDGDVYELNYCMEFYAENININPFETWQRLNSNSPTPFAGYLSHKNFQLLCASPERFLKKENFKLIAQPIKGTIIRGKDEKEDELFKKQLYNNEKERSENVMIVDLMRNDLARSSKAGTVQVEELFGIYSFEKLHQMISTVTAEVKQELNLYDIIRNAFPMGSMTGCPKIKAMELIEEYEDSKRGFFSGALGYVLPQGDFDFNVVIRSIIYNSENKYLSFHAGSAITYEANALSEYEECILKTQSIRNTLDIL